MKIITKEEPSLKVIFYTMAVCKTHSKCQTTAFFLVAIQICIDFLRTDMTKKLTFGTGSSLKIHVCLCNIVATQSFRMISESYFISLFWHQICRHCNSLSAKICAPFFALFPWFFVEVGSKKKHLKATLTALVNTYLQLRDPK